MKVFTLLDVKYLLFSFIRCLLLTYGLDDWYAMISLMILMEFVIISRSSRKYNPHIIRALGKIFIVLWLHPDVSNIFCFP